MGMYERQLLGYNSKLLSIGGKILRLYATGLYTFDELNTMIGTQSYIPVATAAELDALRTTTSQTMGAGTAWEGSYTTGIDKKYVQVDNINMAGVSWTFIESFSGIYDGNNLKISNLTANRLALFYRTNGSTAEFNNIRIIDAAITENATGAEGRGLIIGTLRSGCKIQNCHVSGTIDTTGYTVAGGIGGICGTNNGTITNSSALIDIVGTNQYSGGLVGYNTGTITGSYAQGTISSGSNSGGFVGINTGTITGCYASTTMVVTAGIGFSGGFAGCSEGASSYISKCYCTVSLSFSASNTNNQSGGFAGAIYNNGLVEDCYATGSINTYRRSGGFVGQQGLGGSRLTNCYCAVAVTAVNTSGVFSGYNGGGTHIVTNCYADSDVAIVTTTLYGNLRTTIQMKEGTADIFILPVGGIDATEDPGNAMYVAWDDVDTWDFGTTSEYPTLKPAT